MDLWGGEHLPTTRGRAVHSLCDGDAALEDVILRELGSFLRQTDVRTSALCGRLLHPAIWWELCAKWPTLLFLASRLFILPTSSAGSERTFKALSLVLSRTRNRTLDEKVDKQWRIIVNQKQLRWGDIIGDYTRSPVEQLLIRLVDGHDVDGLGWALGGLDVPAGGALGAAPQLPPGATPPLPADASPPLPAGAAQHPPGAAHRFPPVAAPPSPPAARGGGGGGGNGGMPDGGGDELLGDVDDAVAAALAALDGPAAAGGQPLDVAGVIGQALALDAAGDWLADGDGESDDETPILAADLDAIVETFFKF